MFIIYDFVFLFVVVMFVLLCLKCKKKELMLPDEDERENLKEYNESAGETDNNNYDLAKLVPDLAFSNLSYKLDPFLLNEKKQIENDEGGFPIDYPLDYGFEGTGSQMDDASLIGSLSSYSTETDS